MASSRSPSFGIDAARTQSLSYRISHNPLAEIEGRSEDGDDTAQEDPEKEGEEERERAEKDGNIVDWDHNDPKNPMNSSFVRKCLITAALGGLNFCVTFSSSILSTGTKDIAEEYEVSSVTSTLATSLFVLVSSLRSAFK